MEFGHILLDKLEMEARMELVQQQIIIEGRTEALILEKDKLINKIE